MKITIDRIEDARPGAVRLCSVGGCARSREGRNRLCSAHRYRVRVHGDVMADVPIVGAGEGHSSHPEYQTWKHIKQRCYDVRATNYCNYGGRGIQMAPEWRNDPVAFITWLDEVLGSRPEGHSLDRIDNDRGYEPGNLRWASNDMQQYNTRNSKAAKGVYRWPNGKFHSQVTIRGKKVHLGTFESEAEAREAYLVAKRKIVATGESGKEIDPATVRDVEGDE